MKKCPRLFDEVLEQKVIILYQLIFIVLAVCAFGMGRCSNASPKGQPKVIPSVPDAIWQKINDPSIPKNTG